MIASSVVVFFSLATQTPATEAPAPAAAAPEAAPPTEAAPPAEAAPAATPPPPPAAVDVNASYPESPLAHVDDVSMGYERGVHESQWRFALLPGAGLVLSSNGVAPTLQLGGSVEALIADHIGIRTTAVGLFDYDTEDLAFDGGGAALRCGPVVHLFAHQPFDVALFGDGGARVTVDKKGNVNATPLLSAGGLINYNVTEQWFVGAQLEAQWARERKSGHLLMGDAMLMVGLSL